MKVRIRRFDPDDQQAVVALVLDIQQREFGLALSEENQRDLKDITAYFSAPSSSFWVAEEEAGHIVGCIGLEAMSPKVAVMRKFMVHPNWRGSGNGVSRALLDQFEDGAAKLGVERIILSTVAATRAAQRFYEKSGYLRIDRTNLPTEYTPGPLDSVFFSKYVRAASV